jgi:hypothetical protein
MSNDEDDYSNDSRFNIFSEQLLDDSDNESKSRVAEELLSSFPQCSAQIGRVYGASAGANKEYSQAELTWCVLSKFCPEEADAFLNCCRRGQRGERVGLVLGRPSPKHCGPLFAQFDRCLIRHTEHFEEEHLADPNFKLS